MEESKQATTIKNKDELREGIDTDELLADSFAQRLLKLSHQMGGFDLTEEWPKTLRDAAAHIQKLKSYWTICRDINRAATEIVGEQIAAQHGTTGAIKRAVDDRNLLDVIEGQIINIQAHEDKLKNSWWEFDFVDEYEEWVVHHFSSKELTDPRNLREALQWAIDERQREWELQEEQRRQEQHSGVDEESC